MTIRQSDPRNLLDMSQDNQIIAISEADEIVKLQALALACDTSERPLVSRLITLAQSCHCGSGELMLPVILLRERYDRAERMAIERAQKHGSVLCRCQRAANGLLEQVRVILCRFIKGGGKLTTPVQIADYQRKSEVLA